MAVDDVMDENEHPAEEPEIDMDIPSVITRLGYVELRVGMRVRNNPDYPSPGPVGIVVRVSKCKVKDRGFVGWGVYWPNQNLVGLYDDWSRFREVPEEPEKEGSR